jgi:hypothetical protein
MAVTKPRKKKQINKKKKQKTADNIKNLKCH